MRKTSISLSDDLDLLLRREAERRGVSVSELTREAIASHLGASVSPKPAETAGEGDPHTAETGRDDTRAWSDLFALVDDVSSHWRGPGAVEEIRAQRQR